MLYEIYPKPLADEYKKRRSECASDMYEAISIERDDIDARMKQIRENFNFFGAPVGMIVTIDKSFAPNGWGHVGMFLQNLWLAAIDEGQGGLLSEADEGLLLTTNLRLGRIILAKGDAERALALVNNIAPKTFEAGYSELRGDIYTVMGRDVDARDAYIAAQEAGSSSEGLRMKLDELSNES